MKIKVFKFIKDIDAFTVTLQYALLARDLGLSRLTKESTCEIGRYCSAGGD